MAGDDPVTDLLSETKAPWYVRLGWRVKKGEIMQWLLSFLDARFGANWKRVGFGVVAALMLLAQAIKLVFGFEVPLLSQALAFIASYLSAANPDAPTPLNQLVGEAGVIVTAIVTGILGLVALVQPTLRWLLAKQATTPPK